MHITKLLILVYPSVLFIGQASAAEADAAPNAAEYRGYREEAAALRNEAARYRAEADRYRHRSPRSRWILDCEARPPGGSHLREGRARRSDHRTGVVEVNAMRPRNCGRIAPADR